MMKGWRNSESHISPTATEKEVDAADRGFVIDKDYEQFKRFIDSMHLEGLPDGLSVRLLERLNTGVYAESFVDWTADGRSGRKLSEYLDIRRVADAFNKTITQITGKE